MNPDAGPLNDAQRQGLSRMMYFAFIELRALGWEGKAGQAADLADAFHNLPTGMWTEDFDLKFFRDSFVGEYQRKHPGKRIYDYVALVNEIIALRD